MPESGLRIVELFAGTGGFSRGFERAGFETRLFVDNDVAARNAYLSYRANAPYVIADLRALPASEIRLLAGGTVDGLVGGVPCQGFSLAGLRKSKDERNLLVGRYVEIVLEIEPQFVVLENVSNFIYHQAFEDMKKALSSRYIFVSGIMNAANYGAPQTRHRAFVVAFHRQLNRTPTLPEPTHGFVDRQIFCYRTARFEAPCASPEIEGWILGADSTARRRLAPHVSKLALRPLVTVEDAIGDLPPPSSAGPVHVRPSFSDYQRAMQSIDGRASDHVAREHAKAMRRLIARLPEGGGLEHIPKRWWPQSSYSQAYGRLHRGGLARTVTNSFCNPGSGRYVHPVESRALTLREGARLQGIPDAFQFPETQVAAMQLIGNAIPQPVTEAIARAILLQLS